MEEMHEALLEVKLVSGVRYENSNGPRGHYLDLPPAINITKRIMWVDLWTGP